MDQKFLSYPCYLTQTVTKRLHIGCVGTRMHSRQVTSSCCVASQRIQELVAVFFKYIRWYLMVSKKNHHLCKRGIEKSITQDQHLYSLAKPHDAEMVILGTDFSIPPSRYPISSCS